MPALDAPRIPINSLVGPVRFTMNLRVSKTWGFGELPERSAGGAGGGGGGGGPRGAPGAGRGGPGGGGGFGGFGGGPATNKRYNLTMSVNARNVFNYQDLATPTAVLNPPNGTSPALASPFFARSNQLAQGPFSSVAATRLIYLQLGFTF